MHSPETLLSLPAVCIFITLTNTLLGISRVGFSYLLSQLVVTCACLGGYVVIVFSATR